MPREYGIVANVVEIDAVFRRGAKAWLRSCFSGGERATWLAISRGGKIVEKVAPVHRFENFRCKWIPEHLRDRIFECGSQTEMTEKAAFWEKRAAEARADHPNREFQKPCE